MNRSFRLAIAASCLFLLLMAGWGLAVTAQGPEATPPAIQRQPHHTLYLPTFFKGPYTIPPMFTWASGPEGVLLRWRWPHDAPRANAFVIYRDGQRLGTAQRITQEDQALQVLGQETWDWIRKTYPVTSIAGFHQFLDENPLVELWLADQKYQVALIRGLGYLDRSARQGQTYVYEVVAQTDLGPKSLGRIAIPHKGFTEIPRPTGLEAVQVMDDSLPRLSDWAVAQRNRKANARVFLRWDLPEEPAEGRLQPWISAYDVFRATQPNGPYQRVNVVDGEDKPILPMPAYTPENTEDYQTYPYFYADDDPSLHTCTPYYYRVAPRDMLNHIADWHDPAQRNLFSDPIKAVPPDTIPPDPPDVITPTVNHTQGTITLHWEPVPDAASYIVYRSTDLEAAWPGPTTCVTCTTWVTMTTTSDTTWTDTSARYETRYWYIVRAQDAPCGNHPPNISAPSRAQSAILHDRQPPGQCHISTESHRPYLAIRCGEDTEHILIYCRFDDGPELLISDQQGKNVTYDLSEFYTPARPVDATCRAVAVDDHGNRARPSNWSRDILLTPQRPVPPPSAPILTDIRSETSGPANWVAHLHWEAIPAPCQTGFRIYRQSPHVPKVLLDTVDIHARDYKDATVQWGVVYTYTVTAYRPAGECGDLKEVPSQPRVFRITQPPNLPQRTVENLRWGNNSYTPGQGTRLSWAMETKNMQFVLYRSLERDQGYVAITPPMPNRSSYQDVTALHDHYWYMVVALDPVTGEPFAATTPWSAHPTAQMAASPPSPSLQPAGETPELGQDALPATLYFHKEFELHVTFYTADSTLNDLNGNGKLYLHPPSGLLKVELTFQHLRATTEGHVIEGSITLPDDALPIPVEQGFRYDITAMTVDPDGGRATITIHLPHTIYHHWQMTWPTPITFIEDKIRVADAVTHADLTFQSIVQSGLSCSEDTTNYYQLETLPWKIIPTDAITFTHQAITFGNACALYLERYTDARPASGQPDANDGLLRSVYTSQDAVITPDGLAGAFTSPWGQPVKYTATAPYGFTLTLYKVRLNLQASAIVNGSTSPSGVFWDTVAVDYFQDIPATDPHRPPIAQTPTGHWQGRLSHLEIGPGGSIYAQADKPITYPPLPDISWLNQGFTLPTTRFELYIPPIQSQRLPWQDAIWPAEQIHPQPDRQLESGLNLRADHTALTWHDCSTQGPIAFDDVYADLYIRRGGISDLIEANIPAGAPMQAELDGYQTQLTTFSLAFLDNTLYDSDFSGAFYLPRPADMVVPFSQATLDGNGCIATARVGNATLTPAYWQVTMHPQALAFRPPDPDPQAPGERGLWLIGEVDIPHMAPTDATEDEAAIPLETAFKPNGDFYDLTLQYEGVNYLMDGFAYLLTEVRLSDWAAREAPGWDASATLAAPPSSDWREHGFVQLDGQTVMPIFGPLEARDSHAPPHIYVLGWDRYVGFSAPVRARRSWTVVTDITWDFDLIYAQHSERPRGEFVGFRSDDLVVLDLDQALILNSWEQDHPQFHIFLGLSSGPAVLRSLAETTMSPPPQDFAQVKDTLASWRRQHFAAMDAGYIDFMATLWNKYEDDKTYVATTALIDGMKDKDIPLEPKAGGTKDWLDASGVKLKKMRGDVEWMQDVNTGEWDFEAMRMSLWLDIQKRESDTAQPAAITQTPSDPKEPLLHADRISFYITRDNDYVLEGENIKGSVFKNDDSFKFDSFDATLAINPDKLHFEGGVLFHKLKIKAVTLDPAAAVLGVGQDVYYLGALADGTYKNANKVKVGGAILFGRIDPHSIVLRNIGFSDLLDNLDIIEAGTTSLAGAYLRAYGDVPIYQGSCMYQLNAGGELAIWYFADLTPGHTGPDAWGGRLSGYVYGRLLCAVAARGDITLLMHGTNDAIGYRYRGEFWVAGGLGFCEPENWDTWEHRWWHDSWCWTCGALIRADYNDTHPGDWNWTADADYE